jgi:hypothetical protein
MVLVSVFVSVAAAEGRGVELVDAIKKQVEKERKEGKFV